MRGNDEIAWSYLNWPLALWQHKKRFSALGEHSTLRPWFVKIRDVIFCRPRSTNQIPQINILIAQNRVLYLLFSSGIFWPHSIGIYAFYKFLFQKIYKFYISKDYFLLLLILLKLNLAYSVFIIHLPFLLRYIITIIVILMP